MVAQARVLDLHDLAPDLAQDLLPPLVGLHHIVALCGQVGPLLLGALGLCCLGGQQPAPKTELLLMPALSCQRTFAVTCSNRD